MADMPDLPAAWHSQGYLPHFDDTVSLQSVTYRLADALPAEVMAKLAEQAADDARTRDFIERYLDAGHGSCLLRKAVNATIVLGAWHFFEGIRYRLHAWCVMPNHVHVLLQALPENSVQSIVQSQESYTAKAILQLSPGSSGLGPAAGNGISRHIWQPEYYDRFIRNEEQYAATIAYIHENPVGAGLVARPEEWPWSSASVRGAREQSVACEKREFPAQTT